METEEEYEAGIYIYIYIYIYKYILANISLIDVTVNRHATVFLSQPLCVALQYSIDRYTVVLDATYFLSPTVSSVADDR